jgi:uncharacterized membrane protein YagU involved in acid resistance
MQNTSPVFEKQVRQLIPVVCELLALFLVHQQFWFVFVVQYCCYFSAININIDLCYITFASNIFCVADVIIVSLAQHSEQASEWRGDTDVSEKYFRIHLATVLEQTLGIVDVSVHY